MKHILLILIFTHSLLNAQVEEYITSHVYFDKGQVVNLFGNNVHLRALPETSSEKLAVLPIGSTLKVQEKSEQYFDDRHPFWLKVKHNNQVGYIRSDFIAMQTFELNGVPHYARLKEADDRYWLQIRIPTMREPAYIEKVFEVFSTQFQIKVLDDTGLDDVNHVISLDYIAEACGVDGGGKFIFVDVSNEWHDAFSYVQVSDAGIFYWWEELKFPNEHKQGKHLLYTSEYYVVMDEGDDYEHPNHTEKHWSQRKLYWNGNKIIPSFEQQPYPDMDDEL